MIIAMASIQSLLIGFLIIILIIAILAGIIWFVEKYIHALPDMVKVIIAIAVIILAILWVFGLLGPGIGLH